MYEIMAEAGAGGRIDLSGTTTVKKGHSPRRHRITKYIREKNARNAPPKHGK